MRALAPIGTLALMLAAPLAAQERVPSEWTRLGVLPIEEASGVAVSRQHPGILWVHNDSGDEPRLYAVRHDGTLVATYQVLGARAVDWEDIALGPCPWNLARTCLAIGDIGDNGEERTRVILYFVEEPDPATPGDSLRRVGPARSVRVRYADRPHDAEALLVAPSGDLSIVTKGRTGPIVRYPIPRTALLADSIVATPRDTLPIAPQRMLGRWVTAGTYSQDGGRVAIKTYAEIFLFRVESDRWVPDGPACFIGPREAQGEAIDFLDDSTMVVASERSTGIPAIHRVRC